MKKIIKIWPIVAMVILQITVLIVVVECVKMLVNNENLNTTNEVKEFATTSNIISKSENDELGETSQNIINIIEETNITEENVINVDVSAYFYNQLDEYSKEIYDALKDNKENMKSGTYEIKLGSKVSSLLYNSNGNDLLKQAYQAALEAYSYDNVDVFYIDFQKLYLNIEQTTKGSNVTYKLYLNSGELSNYLSDEFSSQQEVINALAEIENIKTYIIQNKKTSTYENIKFVHDYLIENIEYDQTTSQNNIYNIYGALVNNVSVCEGYAKSFKYLMDVLDIPAVMVAGTATNSEGQTESHAWNYVYINNNWYGIDCTWDDPVVIGNGSLSNNSKYKYFLKGKEELSKTHTESGYFTENSQEFIYPTLSIGNYKN